MEEEIGTCTFLVIRTSDAKRKEISVSLATKLAQLKDTILKTFDEPPETVQRLFYMGRELKSAGRSLQKLGLGKSGPHNVLHMHIAKPIRAAPAAKRQREENTTDLTGAPDPSSSDVIEIDVEGDRGDTVTNSALPSRSRQRRRQS
eukprot:Nitzschia sp. Nitz4//scaffold39_size137210//29428//29946//NITZ4_003190-RA/size137210-augustus-gene-0.180-mRNA-1//1//CDS//3329550356//1085//frame0